MPSAHPFVSFALSPAYGHVFPVLPLAQAVHSAGARCEVAVAKPFLGQLPLPTTAGMTVDPTSTDLRAWTLERYPDVSKHMPSRWVPAFFGVANALPTVKALRAAWELDRPDLVVFDPANPGAAVVAEELGIPSVMFGVFHYFPPMLDLPAVTRRALTDPGVDPWEPVDEAGEVPPYVDPVPAVLQMGPIREHAGEVISIRTTPWDDPSLPVPVIERRGNRPVILLTFGTVVDDAVGFREAIASAAKVGDVLAAVGPAIGAHEGLAGLDGVRLLPFVPLGRVLRDVDLIVHHGGLGTTLAAATRGVPQVVVPHVGDQFANAQAVARAGIGLVTTAADAAEALPGLISEALQSGVREAVAGVAADIRNAPSPEHVAGTVIQMAVARAG